MTNPVIRIVHPEKGTVVIHDALVPVGIDVAGATVEFNPDAAKLSQRMKLAEIGFDYLSQVGVNADLLVFLVRILANVVNNEQVPRELQNALNDLAGGEYPLDKKSSGLDHKNLIIRGKALARLWSEER